MKEEIEELMEYLEIDPDDVFERYLGNLVFYASLLFKFDREPNMARLQKAMETGNYSEGYEAAHALKGSTGALGVRLLNRKAKGLCDRLKRFRENADDEETEREASKLMAEYLDFAEEYGVCKEKMRQLCILLSNQEK